AVLPHFGNVDGPGSLPAGDVHVVARERDGSGYSLVLPIGQRRLDAVLPVLGNVRDHELVRGDLCRLDLVTRDVDVGPRDRDRKGVGVAGSLRQRRGDAILPELGDGPPFVRFVTSHVDVA